MWSALENIAFRESLPTSLETGQSVHGINIAGQFAHGRFNLRHLGYRRSKPYLLKQFFCLDSDAFLRWQNEARFITIPGVPGYCWPCEEWRGGLITPYTEGMLLKRWLSEKSPSLQRRLIVGTDLAHRIAGLHAAGIAHRNLSPECITVGDAGLAIWDFGSALADRWDDLWTDSTYTPTTPAYASSAALAGMGSSFEDDVHAFGALLYRLVFGSSAFGPVRSRLRSVFPAMIPPATLPATGKEPAALRKLITACLSPRSKDRPTITQAATTLSKICDINPATNPAIIIPETNDSIRGRTKVMVFVKDDNRAVSLFDAALTLAEETPSVFLFVGIIPANLPSGHTQRFMGNLFKKLSQGLMRIRNSGHIWSLRLLEDVIPESTALSLVDQYRPDMILLGRSNATRTFLGCRPFDALLSSHPTRISKVG